MTRFSLVFSFAFMILFAPVVIAQTQWTKYEGNPLISPGQADPNSCATFNYWKAWMPTVLFDNGVFKMWYVSYGYSAPPIYSIGHTISADGITWFPYEMNPVLMPGSTFDNGYTWGGTVLKDGTTYKMYYGAYSTASQRSSVGLATSADGLHWTKLSNPVLNGGGTGSWDALGVYSPCVIKDNTGLYKMWFAGQTNQSTTAIGCATSTDGIT